MNTAYNNVTLLITTYNRSKSLKHLLEAFTLLDVSFAEIVVSDDGSKVEHLDEIKLLQKQFAFTLITAEHNQGLGANINKGQDSVKTPYTLYVQEDFEPLTGFTKHFGDALQIMDADKSFDIVRFYAYFKYPYTRPFKNGFSEMLFKLSPFANNHIKFYVYSDHPHLRRSNFLKKFGRYTEHVSVDKSEADMAFSFIRNNGRGLFFNEFNTVFEQVNTKEEPSTAGRQSWRESDNAVFLALRAVYLQFKLLKWTYKLLKTPRI